MPATLPAERLHRQGALAASSADATRTHSLYRNSTASMRPTFRGKRTTPRFASPANAGSRISSSPIGGRTSSFASASPARVARSSSVCASPRSSRPPSTIPSCARRWATWSLQTRMRRRVPCGTSPWRGSASSALSIRVKSGPSRCGRRFSRSPSARTSLSLLRSPPLYARANNSPSMPLGIMSAHAHLTPVLKRPTTGQWTVSLTSSAPLAWRRHGG